MNAIITLSVRHLPDLKNDRIWGEQMKALIINCSPVRTGATAEIVNIIKTELSSRHDTKSICIDDYDFEFCKGCRSCHKTANRRIYE